jgi:ketosteroid isomerase-like protein
VSERNVELLRRWITAFNARDLETMIALSDPNIELHSAYAAVGGASYHDHAGMRKWHGDLEETWGAEIRIEPEDYFDLGEHTLAFAVYHGRGQQSGAEVTMPVTSVVKWRDDRMAYVKVYMQRDAALRDLGVSEDELRPIAP